MTPSTSAVERDLERDAMRYANTAPALAARAAAARAALSNGKAHDKPPEPPDPED